MVDPTYSLSRKKLWFSMMAPFEQANILKNKKYNTINTVKYGVIHQPRLFCVHIYYTVERMSTVCVVFFQLIRGGGWSECRACSVAVALVHENL